MGVGQQCLRTRAKASKMAVERVGFGMVRLAAKRMILVGRRSRAIRDRSWSPRRPVGCGAKLCLRLW